MLRQLCNQKEETLNTQKGIENKIGGIKSDRNDF